MPTIKEYEDDLKKVKKERHAIKWKIRPLMHKDEVLARKQARIEEKIRNLTEKA